MDIVPRTLKFHKNGVNYRVPLLEYNPQYSSELRAYDGPFGSFKFPLGSPSDPDALPLRIQTSSGVKSPIGYLPLRAYLIEDFTGGRIIDSTRDTFYQTFPDPIEGGLYLRGSNTGNEFGSRADEDAYTRTTDGQVSFIPDTDIIYSDSNNRLTFSGSDPLNVSVTIDSQNVYPLIEDGSGTMNCVFRRVYTGGVPSSGRIKYGIDNGSDSFAIELDYSDETATFYANGSSFSSGSASEAFDGNDGRVLIAKSYETNSERYDLGVNGKLPRSAELESGFGGSDDFIGEMGGTDFSATIELTNINVNSFSYDLVASVDEDQL